jgi:hypothetical protein
LETGTGGFSNHWKNQRTERGGAQKFTAGGVLVHGPRFITPHGQRQALSVPRWLRGPGWDCGWAGRKAVAQYAMMDSRPGTHGQEDAAEGRAADGHDGFQA